MKRHTLTAVLFALATPAHASPTDVAPSAVASYPAGPGDVLSITVYRAPDYSSVVEVADDGTIVLASVGKVVVGGLTPPQIGAAVAERFRASGIFRDPQVNVIIQAYRSRVVTVLGAVAKPGEYPLIRGKVRISEILAQSGAILGAGGGSVRLAHKNSQGVMIPAADVLSGRMDNVLEPEDTLIVYDAPQFYISGEVQRAGSYPIDPGLTIGRAIALAGGLTPRGSAGRVKVTRKGTGGDEALKVKPNDPVLPKDLIVVGARIF